MRVYTTQITTLNEKSLGGTSRQSLSSTAIGKGYVGQE